MGCLRGRGRRRERSGGAISTRRDRAAHGSRERTTARLGVSLGVVQLRGRTRPSENVRRPVTGDGTVRTRVEGLLLACIAAVGVDGGGCRWSPRPGQSVSAGVACLRWHARFRGEFSSTRTSDTAAGGDGSVVGRSAASRRSRVDRPAPWWSSRERTPARRSAARLSCHANIRLGRVHDVNRNCHSLRPLGRLVPDVRGCESCDCGRDRYAFRQAMVAKASSSRSRYRPTMPREPVMPKSVRSRCSARPRR